MQNTGLQEAETRANALATAWASCLKAQAIEVQAYARKGTFKSPKACAEHMSTTGQVDAAWLTEVVHDNVDIPDLSAILIKYGQPETVSCEYVERRHIITMTFVLPRFGEFGDDVINLAGRYVAQAEIYGQGVTNLLRREYQNLLDEWLCDAHQWDWCKRVKTKDKTVITHKDGTPIIFRGHFRKLVEAQGFKNPDEAENHLRAQIAQYHHKCVYHMKGIGLLMKTDGWREAGTRIRALNIALSVIEDRWFDHSGEVNSLIEIGHDHATGIFTDRDYDNSSWTNKVSMNPIAEIRQMEEELHHMAMVMNSSTHPLGCAKPGLPDDDYEEERFHDSDRKIHNERIQALERRTDENLRIIKVAAFDRALFQQDVLMQGVIRGSETEKSLLQTMGTQHPWMSKLYDSKDQLTQSPRRDRNSYRTLVHAAICDPTGFEAAMHRCVHNPEVWLPKVVNFLDLQFTRAIRQHNDWIQVVSCRVPTPFGMGRWMIIQYPTGYKALWLLQEMSNIHKPYTVQVWDKEARQMVQKTRGTPFNGMFPKWNLIGIHVAGEYANHVARAFGYRVERYIVDKTNSKGEVVKHTIKSAWFTKPQPRLPGSAYIYPPKWEK